MYNANGDRLLRRFLPVRLCDIHGIELWFEEMSAQGLILDSFGVRSAIFRVSEPEPLVRYRLEPSNFHADRETPASRGKVDWEFVDYEKNADYAQFGWEYVDTIRHYYCIYRCRDPQAEELHTDPVILGHLFHSICASHIGVLVLLLLMALTKFRPRMIWSAWNMPSPLSGLSCLLLYGWALTLYLDHVYQIWNLWKLRGQLLEGIPLDRKRRYPCSPLWSAAALGVPIAAICCLVLSCFLP